MVQLEGQTIVVKIRDGQVVNRPVYTAIGVTVDGQRDILGPRIGAGGEGLQPRDPPRHLLDERDRVLERTDSP